MYVQQTQNPFAKHANSDQNRERWKNDAFINIRLPKADGKEFNVGSLGLKLSHRLQAELIEYFQGDTEAAAEWFREAITIDFRMANDNSGAGLAIPK